MGDKKIPPSPQSFNASVMPMPRLNASEKFVTLFNKTANDLDLGIHWNGDTKGGTPNVPDYNELTLNPLLYGTNSSGTQYTGVEINVEKVLRAVEHKRLQANELAWKAKVFVDSPTFERMKTVHKLNKAEIAFLKAIAPILSKETDIIFGKQYSHSFETYHAYLKEHGETFSLRNFWLTMTAASPKVPANKIPENFKDINDYASSVPGFPKAVDEFSASWPKNFTESEKAYLSKTYTDPQHPANLPYTSMVRYKGVEPKKDTTVVETNSGGQPIKWIIKGEGNNLYLVQNISFDPRLQSHFLNIANGLRKYAGIHIDGETLDPKFASYIMDAASFIEKGDWAGLLKADIYQTGGNLYFTFFPHEGYMDQVRFPVIYELGIRNPDVSKLVATSPIAMNHLEQMVADRYIKMGLKTYNPRTFGETNSPNEMLTIDIYSAGGFLKPWGGIGGHDYPKKSFPGLENEHVTVAWHDTYQIRMPTFKTVYDKLVENKRPKIGIPYILAMTAWHEGTHGVGLRGDDKTLSGKNLDESFGKFWGAWAEPFADAGGVVANAFLLEKGHITQEYFDNALLALLMYQTKFYLPKETYKTDDGIFKNPHQVGVSIEIGYLVDKGVIRFNPETGKVQVAWKKMGPAYKELFEYLTDLSAKGDKQELIAFTRKYIDAIPDNLEKAMIASRPMVYKKHTVYAGQDNIR